MLLQELRASGAVRLNHKKLNKLLGFCERHGNTAVGLEFLKVYRHAFAKHKLLISRGSMEGCIDVGPASTTWLSALGMLQTLTPTTWECSRNFPGHVLGMLSECSRVEDVPRSWCGQSAFLLQILQTNRDHYWAAIDPASTQWLKFRCVLRLRCVGINTTFWPN